MTDAPAPAAAPAATPAAPATPSAAPPAQTPWHQGVDSIILGHWQNKGYDLSDPGKVAIEATRQARELERHFGVPANQLLKLPKDAADEAAWNDVWGRLGVPSAPSDYDLSGIKFADGRDLDAAFADAMRASLHGARVTRDKAPDVVKAVVKFMEDRDTAETAERAAALETERADLRRNWGQNFDRNRLAAMEGARRLGVAPETVAKLEGELGYSAVMEMFRKIGAGTSEDTFHDAARGGSGTPATRQGAEARLQELKNDPSFRTRYFNREAAAVREWDALMLSLHPEAA